MIMRTLLAVHPVSLVLVFTVTAIGGNYTDINLPHEHVKYYFNSFPTVGEKCRDDAACPYKVRDHIQFLHTSFSLCIIFETCCISKFYLEIDPCEFCTIINTHPNFVKKMIFT